YAVGTTAACGARAADGLRIVRKPLTTTTHRYRMTPETIPYPPSGAQKPSRAQVVPPSRTSTTAATPSANAALEIISARQSPNDPAMTNIAAENNTITDRAHPRSLSAD